MNEIIEDLNKIYINLNPDALSIEDASKILIFLSHSSENKEISTKIFNKISSTKEKWLNNDPIHEVILRLLAIISYSPDTIDGSTLGILAKRLIEIESEPGGPYILKNDQDLTLNVLIAQLFNLLGTPLINVDNYISSNEIHIRNQKIPKWMTVLPNKLTINKKFILESEFDIFCDVLGHIKINKNPDILSQNKINSKLDSATIRAINTLKKHGIYNNEISILCRKITEIDKYHEITQISSLFQHSFLNPTSINDEILNDLGVSNFFAWLAYSIFDNIIDHDGDEDLLPYANIIHRLSYDLYKTKTANQRVDEFFSRVDYANINEITNYRCDYSSKKINLSKIYTYRDTNLLYEKSIGHILGPCILLDQMDVEDSQKEYIEQALKHYLIARQLNDDLHDWSKDFSKGQINYVVAELLSELALPTGEYKTNELLIKMRKIFWQKMSVELTELAVEHIDESLELFEKSSLIKMNSIFIKQIIMPIKISALNGLKIIRDQKSFLESYM